MKTTEQLLAKWQAENTRLAEKIKGCYENGPVSLEVVRSRADAVAEFIGDLVAMQYEQAHIEEEQK